MFAVSAQSIEFERRAKWRSDPLDNAESISPELAFSCSRDAAYSAMVSGLPALVVDETVNAKETLSDMLSEHTCNYLVSLSAANPCDLLAVFLAEGLRSRDTRVKAAAEAYAKRIALDYATAHELRGA